MRPSSAAIASLIAGGAAVGGAALGWGLVDRTPVRPSAPTTDAAASTTLPTELPPIADLAHYRGSASDPWRDRNPFVPWALRETERLAGGRPPQQGGEPIAPEPDSGDESTASNGTDQPERLTPPPLTRSESTLQLLGVLSGPGTELVRVRLGAQATTLRPGGRIADWHYRGLDAGLAWFTAPDGSRHGFQVANLP